MEPAAKKAKIEEAPEALSAVAPAAPTSSKAASPAAVAASLLQQGEWELDEEDAYLPERIQEPAVFHAEDTTLNVMPASVGNILTPLTDGGFQYLLAGARASVGVRTGRYAFEVRVLGLVNPLEDTTARSRVPAPRHQLRVGFAASGSSLFVGETFCSVCFDTEGNFVHNGKRELKAQPFGRDSVLCVVLNLDSRSPNAGTVSLFRNGRRVSPPIPLPESLRGRPLHPAVGFKNMTLEYNFTHPFHAPLPFRCRMIGEAAQEDVSITSYPVPKDGMYEALFQVGLPEEGTFDFLDYFLERNPHFTELSDRAILNWAEKSGLRRQQRPGFSPTNSADKPDAYFGIMAMDDQSLRRMLQATVHLQRRCFIVMEVQANLLKDRRKEQLRRWFGSFHKVALVVMGRPSAEFLKYMEGTVLKQKQEAADAEWRARHADEKRKKILDLRQQQVERTRRKALRDAERHRKLIEEEKNRKLAECNGAADAAPAAEAEAKDGAAAKAEEPKAEEPESDGEEATAAAIKTIEESVCPDPPRVELAEEERRAPFRKRPLPDMSAYSLNLTFMKFSVPEQDEGFDEIRYEWEKGDACRKYLRSWTQERKLTTRIEDLTPGDWFHIKLKEWQREMQSWHSKQAAFRASAAKRAQEAQQRAAQWKAHKAAREAAVKAAADKAALDKAAAEKAAAALAAATAAAGAAAAAAAASDAAPATSSANGVAEATFSPSAVPAAGHSPQSMNGTNGSAEAQQAAAAAAGAPSPAPGVAAAMSAMAQAAAGAGAALEGSGAALAATGASAAPHAQLENEEERIESSRAAFDKLDVFGVEDIHNCFHGEPLYSQFAFEDWTMMTLRFELHLLAHAFRRDVNDHDRLGIHLEHLGFYYNKYFKKPLNLKFYGVETHEELLELIHDTVLLARKPPVVEPQLPDDLESWGIFVMLTEECRRDRQRRIHLGDESARLRLTQPGAAVAAAAAAAGGRVAGQSSSVMPPSRPGGAYSWQGQQQHPQVQQLQMQQQQMWRPPAPQVVPAPVRGLATLVQLAAANAKYRAPAPQCVVPGAASATAAGGTSPVVMMPSVVSAAAAGASGAWQPR